MPSKEEAEAIENNTQDMINKYNAKLREVTLLRDELRDQVVTLDAELKLKRVQELNDDNSVKKDQKTGAPTFKFEFPKNRYTGKPMTKQEHDDLCKSVCKAADDILLKISQVKKN